MLGFGQDMAVVLMDSQNQASSHANMDGQRFHKALLLPGEISIVNEFQGRGTKFINGVTISKLSLLEQIIPSPCSGRQAQEQCDTHKKDERRREFGKKNI